MTSIESDVVLIRLAREDVGAVAVIEGYSNHREEGAELVAARANEGAEFGGLLFAGVHTEEEDFGVGGAEGGNDGAEAHDF
jgi:hypothetical protein